jgi:predicted cupin superfamily sugar epimerase
VGPGFDFADFALLADLPLQDHPAGADPTLL